MKRLSRQFTLLFLICSAILSFRLAVPIAAIPQNTPSKAVRNVLVVTMDGMRWQEVFAGMTADLLTPKDGGVSESAKKKVEERFGGATAEERRAKVLPFIWTTIAKTGQVFGDPSKGSDARVTNGLRFSYPGYNEILSGFPDSRIDSNDRKPNPNVTVLEWLNGRAPYKGRVAAFCSWDTFPWILNRERSGIVVNAGFEPMTFAGDRTHLGVLNQILADTTPA